jgi:hypothetical protein
VALDSLQPVGDLCDLLGVSRCRPGVFQAMVELLYGEPDGEAQRSARLGDLGRRLTGRR